MRSARDAAVAQRPGREAHHHLGPADQRDRRVRVEGAAVDQLRDDADVARPPGAGGVVDDELEVGRPRRRPAAELLAVEELLGLAAAVEQHDRRDSAPALGDAA